MKISSDYIYNNGSYLKNNPGWGIEDSEWKATLIYQLYKKNNICPKKITDTGCGTGAVLGNLYQLDTNTEIFEGFDISAYATDLAKQKSNPKIKFYNEDITLQASYKTDLLLVIDVLEHIDNYYDFLRKIHDKSSYFIFHIPLDLSCRTILKPHVILQQRQSVGHIHYFSEETIRWSLNDIGFEIIDWKYTKPVADRSKSKSFKTLIKKSLRNISFTINKSVSVKLWGNYSILVLAKSST